MTISTRIILSLLIAVAAAVIAALLQGQSFPDLLLLVCFVAATVITALLPAGTATASRQGDDDANRSQIAEDAEREKGKVKWFNVSKGFGFIVRENGEEVFVHFRSIRGDGRRSLRDGQQVDFVVGNSAKGPQAEDVVALD